MKAISTNLKKIATMVLFLSAATGFTNAQKSFVFNDIPDLLAGLNSEILSEIILSAESTRTSYNIYYETELELEDWMIDYDRMSVTDTDEETMTSVVEVEEEAIKLEEWMVQSVSPEFLIADQEKELELEGWMIGLND